MNKEPCGVPYLYKGKKSGYLSKEEYKSIVLSVSIAETLD